MEKSTPTANARTRKRFPIIKFCIAMLIVCAGVCGVLVSQVAFSGSEYTPEELYQAAKDYDYSKGRDRSIESYIKKYLDQQEDLTPADYNYTLKSKIEYYYGINQYHAALTALDEFGKYLADFDDQIYLLDWYTTVFNALGNPAKAKEYSTEKDRLVNKCSSE